MKQQYLVFAGDEYLGTQMAGHAQRAEYLFAKKRGLDHKALAALDFNKGTDKLAALRKTLPAPSRAA